MPMPLEVKYSRELLVRVSDAFSHMVANIEAVDWSLHTISDRTSLRGIAEKLVFHLSENADEVSIKMSSGEWMGYTNFLYYASTFLPEIQDRVFLESLYDAYDAWEENNFMTPCPTSG